MKKIGLLLSLLFIVEIFSLKAQNNVGIGILSPDQSAVLHLQANDKGLLVPRLTTAERTAISSPAVGLLVFDTESNCFFFYRNSTWESLCAANTSAIGITGYTGATGATGLIGATGLQGWGGITGATGQDGTNGIVGITGATGQNGNNGAIGVTGATGNNGNNGAVGVTGATGNNGNNGAVGVTGATGNNGNNGAVGVTGATGNNGNNGTVGVTGTTGNNGNNGAVGVTGATGNNGTNGPIGVTGATGNNGTNGEIGVTGATGNNGNNGAVGVTGATGNNGTVGAIGVTGATGNNGTNGEIGVTGATGNNGNNGAVGVTGATGNNGMAGAIGVTGATGNNGTNGAIGVTGATGNNGNNGAAGITGATGNNGNNGVVGVTGATGNNGTVGITGATGNNGNNGAVGATGATGNNGNNGEIGVTGATGNNGNNGEIGVTGATGNNGNNGEIGVTGVTGNNGNNGEIGATGATGNNGNNGEIGATGATGNNGNNGEIGVTGATGNNGNNGEIGVTGATGNNGNNGEIGATGATGNNGNNGEIGVTGATGNNGTNGTNGVQGVTGATGPVGCASGNYILKSTGTSATCTVAPVFEDNSGNVGIGTVSPVYKLDVTGDVNYTSTVKNSGVNVLFGSPTDVYANIRVISNLSSVSQDGMYIGYNGVGGTNAHLRFYANGTTERVVISAADGSVRINNLAGSGSRMVVADASGTLGIGTGTSFSSSGIFNVYNVGNTLLNSNYVLRNATNNSGFYQDNQAPYDLNYVAGDNSMPYGFAINDGRTGEHAGFLAVPQTSNGANTNMIFYVGNDGSNQFQFSPFTWDGANNHIGTPVMTIGAFSGLVGIGLSNPGAKLTIRQNATDPGTADDGKALFISGGFGSGQVYDGGVEFRHDNLTQGVGFGYQSVYSTGSNANQPLNIHSKGTDPLILNYFGGGNVGIGTNTPVDKLDVRSAMSVNEIKFRNLDGGDDSDPYRLRKLQTSSNNNVLELQLNDDSDEEFRIKGNSCTGTPACSEYAGVLAHRFIANGQAYHQSLAGTGSRPVYTDANGMLNTNGRVYTAKTAASSAFTTGVQTILTTNSVTVVSGELLKIDAAIELRNVSGSGNDRWRIVMNVTPCGGAATEVSRTITATPYNNHGTYNYYPYVDMWVATCTGNTTFTFTGERFDSDDSWDHRNVRILVTKE